MTHSAIDTPGITPLHEAAWKGEEAVVSSLLIAGASPNAKCTTGATPLHYASWRGHTRIVEILLNHGAQINLQDSAGWSPLHHAIRNGHRDVELLLRGKGAKLDIFEAACLGDIGRITAILCEDATKASTRQAATGWTPLFFAGNRQVALELLSAGADVNAVDCQGYSALHAAASQSDSTVLRCLLEHGAKVNASTSYGRTPLHEAAEAGYVRNIAVLLDFGADVLMRDGGGCAAADIALEAKHLDAVQCLQLWSTSRR